MEAATSVIVWKSQALPVVLLEHDVLEQNWVKSVIFLHAIWDEVPATTS